MKDIVIFILDPPTMEAVAGGSGLKLTSQLEVTAGPIGRSAESNLGATKEGVRSTFPIAYSKGAFAGLDIKGAVVGPRTFVNKTFYNKECTRRDMFSTTLLQSPSLG